MIRSRFAVTALLAAVLALGVVTFGAYVRLSDAGLGCPDWPGCYGRLGAPTSADSIAEANADFPHRPVESAKAWKEMVHRYLAGTLGLVILGLTVFAWRHRRHGAPLAQTLTLLGVVAFQALLGMWTVTLLVKPAIVTAHLLGGLATLALLWWLFLRQGDTNAETTPAARRLRPWVWGGLALLLVQIFLGGWTSTNYAALACTDFPACHAGQWWPRTDFGEGLRIWRELGVNYEFGVLDSDARTAIHLAHRLGALGVLLYLGGLAGATAAPGTGRRVRQTGLAIAIILLLQIGLGISNVLAQLPLPVAVAHNGGAALLLLSLVTLIHLLHPRPGAAVAPRRSGAARLGLET
jgi:cytochrome c oxidase assembly protein subunit 15